MQHENYALVTGGGSGIGRAVALALAGKDLSVIITGRRQQPLDETRREDPERIRAVSADISTDEGRAQLCAALPEGARLRCLVHNAGTLEPVAPIDRIDLRAWRRNQAINVEAPLFLTQALLPKLDGGRVLHVSSGAAHRPVPGWTAYCVAKAGLFMLYRCLDAEFGQRNVLVGSMRPGVVDTDMQALIRGQGSENFPQVEHFRDLHRQGQLHAPEEVAAFAAWLLLDCNAEDYPRREWTLDDESHHHLWKSPGQEPGARPVPGA